MILKPRYGLNETLYFYKGGELSSIKVDVITVAREGLPGFNSQSYHNSIFYIDDYGICAPECLCYTTEIDAIKAEIKKLEKMLDNKSI